MAITMAPASTARPASWPPIRRESSGTVADAVTARTRACGFVAGGSPRPPGLLEPGPGDTVGNSPAGSVGVTPVPIPVSLPPTDTGGSVTGTPADVLLVGLGVADAAATRVIVPEASP